MKKHPIISTVCYVAGVITILSLILYLLKDYLPFSFFGDSEEEAEPEEDFFETPADEGADTIPPTDDEKEEKRPAQNKVRRGYIPVKFHTHEAEEA